MLLERRVVEPPDAVEHLAGMQAQEPQAPYVGLWSRLTDFRPEELSASIAERRLVRSPLMRSTIHLVSARDCLRLWPLMRPVFEQNFRGSPFSRRVAHVDLDALVTTGRELIADEPLSRAELGRLLAERWPGVDPPSLAYAITYLSAVVQVPPRGLWRRTGQARWTTVEAWLGSPLELRSPLADVVLRYLAAFGPATVRDIQAWCGLTRLRPVIEGLRERLRTFRAESGTELVDVPHAPLPEPDRPAPPRFLPPFDNALLAHADRSRIIAAEYRDAVYTDRLMRTFLVDGFVAGTWRIDGRALLLRLLRPLDGHDRAALVEEGERLLRFATPLETRLEVRFID